MKQTIYVYKFAFYDATRKKLNTNVEVYLTEDKAKQHYNQCVEFYQRHHSTQDYEEIQYGSNFIAHLKDGSIAKIKWYKDVAEE